MTEIQRTGIDPGDARGSGDQTAADDAAYQAALGFLYDRINYERMTNAGSRYQFRLKRITELLRQVGLDGFLHADSPRPKVPLVHIAGTKGKGSTAAMVAAALTEAGLRTGLYSSPHLHCLEERFCVDGQPCSTQQLISLVKRVEPATARIEQTIGGLSFFELTTAIALMHFDATRCDAIVLEVGLGGRLDSTNVCSSSVSAITSIGLDHQHVLGETLSEIAAEKAGILKPGIPVISGVADADAAEVVAAQADDVGSTVFQLGRDFDFDYEALPQWGSRIRYRGHRPPLSEAEDTTLLIEGKHQARNAALSIAIIDLLRDQGITVPSEAIRAGLGRLQCAGRVERVSLPKNVLGIVDAAHNHDSIAALCDCLRSRLPNRRIAVVFGTSVDKSAQPMLDLLAEITDELFLTRFLGNPRFRPPAELTPLVAERLARNTSVLEDPIAACEAALASVTPGGALVICGSFFLAAECRDWLAAKSAS